MVFKDIDLSFKKTFNGLGTKEGDDAIIQLVNDAVKTKYGEEIYDVDKGSFTLIYAQGTRDSFAPLNLRDEIYFALSNQKAISLAKKDIVVELDEENSKFNVKITITERQSNRTVTSNLVFNFK